MECWDQYLTARGQWARYHSPHAAAARAFFARHTSVLNLSNPNPTTARAAVPLPIAQAAGTGLEHNAFFSAPTHFQQFLAAPNTIIARLVHNFE